MKHRKFVKQLMAMGYDRNSAEARARIHTQLGKSYEDALAYEKAIAAGCEDFYSMMERVAESIRPAVEAAIATINRVVEAISATDWTDSIECAKKQLAEAGKLPPDIDEQWEAFNRMTVEPIRAQLRQEWTGQGGGGNE